MKKEYWLNRWKQEDTGFHQSEINPYLSQYWPCLPHTPGSTVFVPLCGKSRDMLWLRQQGHAVLGVELSILAAQAFFTGNGLIPHRAVHDQFTSLKAGDIDILCGDFFDLRAIDLTKISAVYDRAALIALPPEMRKRYVDHLLHILPPDVHILLITLDYPAHEMPGPPFPVPPDEVTALYRSNAVVTLLSQHDVLAANPRFQERGLTRLQENIFLLKTHNANMKPDGPALTL